MNMPIGVMLTENQKKTFQEIKEGKLNQKQKADFYYRMSKILKNELEEIEELSRLLDELPDSYLEKVNFAKTTIAVMKLTEKLVEKVDPTVIVDGKAVRIFKVRRTLCIPGIEEIVVTNKVTYTPTEEEKCFFGQFADHIKTLEATISPAKDSHVYTPEEFTDETLAKRIGWKWSSERGLIIAPGCEIAEEFKPEPGTDDNLLILNAMLQAQRLGHPVPEGQIEKLMKLCRKPE